MTTKSRTDNYWEQRSIERQLLSEQKLSKYEKQIRSSYTKGMNAIETDLNLIMDNYQKYVNKRFGVQLSRTEASEFLNAVVDPSTMGQLRGRWKSRGVNIDEILAQTGNYSSRITNKQMYRQSVDLVMGEIANQEIEISKMAYTDIISDSYNRKIFDISKGTGLDLSMQSIDLNQIQNIMNMNWSGEHFSSRVWRNTSQVAKELKGLFTIDMLSNRPTTALINDLDNFTDYGRYASARLIRTESNAMRTETEAQVSMDLGLEKYRILATLDMKTSEVCQKMDLKVFLYKDLKIGETAPPFHPNCRTITQDHFDDVDYSKLERIARDPKTGETMYVPGDMTYEEWMNGKKTIKKPNLTYKDVTQEWLDAIDHTKEGKVIESDYFEKDGVRYDSSNSVLRYSVNEDERKFTELLSQKYHKDISFVPRVKPKGVSSDFISTPDFHMDDQYWELKTIDGSGKNTILDSIKRGKNQSSNFLLSITEKSNLTNRQIIEQINAIYSFKRYEFVEDIMVFKNQKLHLKAQKKR